MTLSATTPMYSSTGIEPGSVASPMQPWSCGIWAIRTRRYRRATARTLAQELSYPFSVATARVFAAMSPAPPGESTLTQEWAEAAITLAREQGFSAWLGPGTVLQGWALAEQGQSEEGIAQIRQGLATRQAIGAGIFRSYFLALLAEVYGKAGQVEEGLAALAEALTVVDKSGERFYEAELYRLQGRAYASTSLKVRV